MKVKTFLSDKNEFRLEKFEKEDRSKNILHLSPIKDNVMTKNILVWTVETKNGTPHNHQYLQIDSVNVLFRVKTI